MAKAKKRKRVQRVARGKPMPGHIVTITDDAAKVKSFATITSSTPPRPPTAYMASTGSQYVRQQDGTRKRGVGSLPVWMASRIREALC